MARTLKYDLDTDTTLGGNSASDYVTPSQKAIKSYVDNHSGGGTATDVQINGTSITSNNVANIVTNTAYNASSNKIATMSDVPSISGLESTSNKVTSISSSSTDTQYPSAKSVVELLKTIYPVGAIFIGTTATCPMSALFGTWTLVAEDRCLQGSSTNHSANTTVAAGLPNITGGSSNFVSTTSSTPASSTDGAITTVAASGVSVGNSSSTRYMRHITFSASDSNSIYGNSTTVQPPAYVVNVWRRTA